MKELAARYQELFEEVRRLHNRLRWTGDQLHAPAGLTAVTRSLLLSVYREGEATVPDLARERLVSRQIIQTQINGMLEESLLETRTNPRHRRSKLLALSAKGRKTVEAMLTRETALMERAGSPLSEEEVAGAARKLRRMREHLEDFGDPASN